MQQMEQEFKNKIHELNQAEVQERTNDARDVNHIVFQACRKKTHYHNSGGIRLCTDELCELCKNKPVSSEYKDKAKRLTTLQNVCHNIHDRELIAESGYYLKGNMLNCFSCGDQQPLHCVKPETLDTNHARQAPYCSHLIQVVGVNFICAAIEIEKRNIPLPTTQELLSICKKYYDTSGEAVSLNQEISHLRQYFCPLTDISANTEQGNVMLTSEDNTEIAVPSSSRGVEDWSMQSLEQESSNPHQITANVALFEEIVLTNVSPCQLQSQHEIATRRIVENYEPSNQNQVPLYTQLAQIIGGVNQARCDIISNPAYARFPDRLNSFHETASFVANPYHLALSGFYYHGYSDCVQCFFCGGCLRCLSSRSVASMLHAKYYPNCYYNFSLLGAERVNYYHALPLPVVLGYDDFTGASTTYTSNFEEGPEHFNSLIACRKCLTRKISLHFFHPPYEPGYICLCLNCGQGFMQCYCSQPSHCLEMSIL